MRPYLILLFTFFAPLPEFRAKSFESSNTLEKSLINRRDLGILKELDPDFYRNVTQLITSKGYPCEDHEVVTEDGFILSLQRIPAKSSLPKPPVVYLQHGLLDSSATWVINFPNQSLGFLLADAGCDVWMGNVRGNTYSKRHIKYTTSDKNFWDWSWDEMAKYDIPAMLKYISSKTGSQEINYIGHSQGTLVAFASISRNPEVAKLVKKLIALGPIAMVGGINGFLRVVANIVALPQLLFNFIGSTEFMPTGPFIKTIIGLYCRNIFTSKACETIILMGGLDENNANISRIPVYGGHNPAGTSSKNIIHFAQMIRSKLFQMYDYKDASKNFAHYNQNTAPLYIPKDVKVPTYLFYGGRDDLSTPQDVELLIQALPNVVLPKKIPQYKHLDFVWGLDAAKVIYEQIIEIIKN